MAKKFRISFLGILLSVVTLFVTVAAKPVLAAETNGRFDTTANVVSDVESNDADNGIMRVSDWKFWGRFTFTNDNWGAYHTVHGNRMRYIIAFKKAPIDSQDYSVSLYTACYQYGGKLMTTKYCHAGGTSEFDSDGFGYYYSNWFDITSGVDYRLYYDAFTAGGGGNGNYRSADVKVWIQTD